MARVYGRTYDEQGNATWVEVDTDQNGFNDAVNLTWLAQALYLNLSESPFFADWGIPAHQSVTTQVYPDFYVMRTQTRFAGMFASIIISKVTGVAASKFHASPPTYDISVITNLGAKLPPVTIPTSIPV
jgi:hypothetical protein